MTQRLLTRRILPLSIGAALLAGLAFGMASRDMPTHA
jgi:hypothetical protein